MIPRILAALRSLLGTGRPDDLTALIEATAEPLIPAEKWDACVETPIYDALRSERVLDAANTFLYEHGGEMDDAWLALEVSDA